jgi:PAS domain S-box-containing protein
VTVMTNPPPLADVTEVLGQSRYPLVAFTIDSLIILGANEAAYELLGGTPGSLDGTEVNEVLRPVDDYVPSVAWKLLASAEIEGYRATCHVRERDGTQLTVHTWVRMVTASRGVFGLAMIMPESTEAQWSLLDATVDNALIVTDDDWRVTHVSTGIERIVGYGHEIHNGASLLGLLHPDDFPRFMKVVDDVAAHGRGAMLRTRLHAGYDRWQEVWGLVVAMSSHIPPSLGLAIAGVPQFGHELLPDLHLPLSLFGDCVIGDGVFGDGDFGVRGSGRRSRLETRLPSVAFSPQQKEILMRLVRGERVREIASSMYLSPSTVRNHLTAIYKKVGVHSQTELLVKLLESIG